MKEKATAKQNTTSQNFPLVGYLAFFSKQLMGQLSMELICGSRF
jgi:hypothetical protein